MPHRRIKGAAQNPALSRFDDNTLSWLGNFVKSKTFTDIIDREEGEDIAQLPELLKRINLKLKNNIAVEQRDLKKAQQGLDHLLEALRTDTAASLAVHKVEANQENDIDGEDLLQPLMYIAENAKKNGKKFADTREVKAILKGLDKYPDDKRTVEDKLGFYNKAVELITSLEKVVQQSAAPSKDRGK